MPISQHPTKSASTLRAYPARARLLIQQCRRNLEVGPHEALGERQLVGWLIHRKTTYSASTWRQYKASISHFLEREVTGGSAGAEEALAMLAEEGTLGCAKHTNRSSGSKLKRLPYKQYQAVLAHLEEHPSTWSGDLSRWLNSALLTGLRPSEWTGANMEINAGAPILVIDNAKATNGRAHGPTRTLILDGLSAQERTTIAEHVERVRGFHQAGEFDRIRDGCARLLVSTQRKLWPKRKKTITLYSARHQFTADAKASGFSTEELAAMMGHAVDTTATRHYGRGAAGWGMTRVRPAQSDVERVRRTFQPQPASMTLRHKGLVKPHPASR